MWLLVFVAQALRVTHGEMWKHPGLSGHRFWDERFHWARNSHRIVSLDSGVETSACSLTGDEQTLLGSGKLSSDIVHLNGLTICPFYFMFYLLHCFMV